MKNRYEIRGDVTAIFINGRIHGPMETLISTEKLEMVEEFPYTWCTMQDARSGNIYCQGGMVLPEGKRVRVLLHRWVTGSPKGYFIDHINHNALDNTDGNLRIVTNGENQQNRLSAQVNSTTGVRGVVWSKHDKKYQARVLLNGKLKSFGNFDEIWQAEIAVKEARARLMPYSPEAM